jgi:flagellar hook-associated protein 3 FlgL
MTSVQRVTTQSTVRLVLDNLQTGLGQLQNIQEQLSSGKAISRPGDSPTGTISALDYRADIRRSQQLVRNADDGITMLGSADSSIQQGLDLINRARSLVQQGISGAVGANDRAAMADEIDQLRTALLGFANTSLHGQAIFSGTTAGPAAYGADGSYLGNAGTQMRTVAPGVTVQVNLTGPDVFGPPGTDVFQVLADAAQHLRTDPSQLGADLDKIDTAHSRMTNALALVGARYDQVDTMRSSMNAHIDSTTAALSGVEDVDFPQAAMQLQMHQVSYQAALAATAHVLQPSLVDFLK